MSREMEVGVEVVDDLGEDTGPVDRVDSSETVCGVELYIGEERLDRVLPEVSNQVGHRSDLSPG
jgi:hypothetical protein